MEVADSYIADVNEREVQAHQVTAGVEPMTNESKRLGSGEVRITSLEFLDGDGAPSPVLLAGAPCTMRMHYVAQEPVRHVIFGLGFLHESGANVAGPNSGRQGSWSLEQGDGYVDFVIDDLLLQPGSYRVSTAIVDRGHMYDYADREFDLHVRGRGNQEPGFTTMPGTFKEPVTVAHTAPKASAAIEVVHAE
jgi:ABC-2 type transport system ATP-binding protein/lipopolysaccharide transport system ATP-binding protein